MEYKVGDPLADVSQLSVAQLLSIQLQLDAELIDLNKQMQSMVISQAKLQSSTEIIFLTPGGEGHDVLIPITRSMLVMAKLSESPNLIVHIGEDIYVTKDSNDAADCMKQKVKNIKEQMAKTKVLTERKVEFRNAITTVLEEEQKLEQTAAKQKMN